MPSTEYSILASKLTKRFGDFTAVDETTFGVLPGEIFSFLGVNGAGKSIAIRMLAGLLKPSLGYAEVAGYDVCKETELIKRNVGYMSQEFLLYDYLSVEENTFLYGRIYDLSRRIIQSRMERPLEELSFYNQRKLHVGSLPLGWKQKLAFSVAIFHRPKVVFLDEPTGGVDLVARRRLWKFIYNAAAEGITVFVTIHYMNESEYYDRISIMVDGQIKALDTPRALKRQFDCDLMDEVFYQLTRDAECSG